MKVIRLFTGFGFLTAASLGADVIETTRQRIAQAHPDSVAAVRCLPALVSFSDEMKLASTELKRFLYRSLYRHPQVMATTDTAKQVVSELFALYRDRPHELPADYAESANPMRAVADYIAGMTDRFAIREHHRLTERRVFLD